MNQSAWKIFLAAAAALIAGFSFFLLYNSKENERKIRVQKEVELARKVAELTDKENELSGLLKQKTELEEQFNLKIAALESASRESEESARALASKLESALKENDALKNDLAAKEKKLNDLTRKIKILEADKADLLDTIAKSSPDRKSDDEKTGSFEGLASSKSTVAQADPVKLGKIVVQKISGRYAKVQHIDKIYGFVIVDAGFKDGMRDNTVLNIVRRDRLIGKAVVQKVRTDVSAAVLLPEWTKEEIKIGDLVSKF